MVHKTSKYAYRKFTTLTGPTHKSGGVDLVKRENGGVYVQKKATGPFHLDLLGKEYRALSTLDHPHIVKMVDSFINPEKMIGAIYLTYYDQGDLTCYVKNHRESETPIANDVTWNIFSNICAALAFCHHGIRSPHDDANPPPTWSAIIHRDIKTDNIFLQSDPTAPGNIIAILGDFDWSTNLSLETTIYRRPTDGSSYQSPADPRWLPPESPRYTMASDVWGLGAVVTCMCRLVASPEECQVSDGVPPSSSSSSGRFGPALQRLVKRAVAWEPRERLSAWGLWRGIVEAEAEAEAGK